MRPNVKPEVPFEPLSGSGEAAPSLAALLARWTEQADAYEAAGDLKRTAVLRRVVEEAGLVSARAFLKAIDP